MFTKRSVAAAGAYLDGATPWLTLCAILAPIVWVCTFSFGIYLHTPVSCAVPTMLGMRAAAATRRDGTLAAGVPKRSNRGYFQGLLYLILYFGLLASAVNRIGGPDDLWSFAVAIIAFSQAVPVVFYVGFFYAALVNDGLEITAGCSGQDQNPPDQVEATSARSFLNGCLTLLPAFIVTMFEFTASGAWHFTPDFSHRSVPASPIAVVVEMARLTGFVMVLWLHQTFLTLLLARIRAARLGIKTPPLGYLQVLCILSALVIGVLCATLACLSRSPG